MSTPIDSLTIEIQSNSSGAAQGIDALAASLGKLKANGSIGVAVKNLNNLTVALKGMTTVTSNANKLSALADAMAKLKAVGSVGSGIKKLAESLSSLKSVDYASLSRVADSGALFEKIAGSLGSLSSVKTGGFATVVNSLAKIGQVTDSLDDGTIDRFAARVKKLTEVLTPLSSKMTTVQAGLRGIKSEANSAGDGMTKFSGKVNTTTLNLSSLINVANGVISALRPIVRLLHTTIGSAMEWDGIEYQFGNAFGEQADEYYAKITKITDAMGLNKQTFMENSAMATSMLKGFGVNSSDAREMGVGYTELAYDIWAAYNNVYKKFDGADGAMAAIRSAIAGEVEPIRRAGFTIVESTLAQTAANHNLDISIEKATEAQKSYLRYLTLVDQAQSKGVIGTYAKEMDTAEGLTRTLTQQLKSLSQAFGSLFLPILVKVLPWIQAFVELLTDAVRATASFFGIEIQPINWSDNSGLEGLEKSADDANGKINDTVESLKKLKNATIGIDELNVISPTPAGSGSGGGGENGGGFGDLNVGSLWDDTIFDEIQFEVDTIKSQLKEALSSVTAIVSGFMLAIGTILVASGANIPMGLALMAAGAVGLVATIAVNWNSMSEQLAETLSSITGVVGGFLLALGAILAFTGANVGLGIGLMALGAVSLGTAIAINWKFLEGDLKSTLSTLTAIVSGGVLALGAVLAFSGANVGLGIALIAAGAVGLVTSMALNWDSLSEPTRQAIGVIGSIAGGSLLAIGLVIALTGGSLPLGIGLMAAGAATLASSVALNWDSLTGETKNKVATITAIVSGALLGIGAVLAFSGAATPLGIALIAAGAIGLASAVTTLNWDTVKNELQGSIGGVVAIVSGSLLAIGAILAFSGVGLVLGISLMAAGAAGLATTISANWETIKTKLQGPIGKIVALVSGALLVIGAILAFSGVGLGLGIGLMAAGAAGLATTVALNWDTIKTSITNAINKIKEWVSTYGLLALGVILCLTGGAIPLGIALIKQGLETKTKSGSTVGDELLKTIKEKWAAIKEWWNSKPELKKISTKIEDIKAKVSEKWDAAKTWWSDKKEKLKTYTPSIGSIYETVKERWNTAKNWWAEKKEKLSTYTPSIGDIKSKVSTAWTTAKNWWTNTKSAFGTYTPNIGDIKSKVSTAWTTAKNWWANSKSAMSTYTPSIGSIRDKVSSAWTTARNWWSNTKTGMSTYTPSIGSIKTALTTKWNEAKKWWNDNVKLSIPSLSFKVTYTTSGLNAVQKAVVNALNLNGWPKLSFAANGGMFDAGSLIWAGEAGAEVVANAGGGRTGVMNVQQMQEAVYEGVYAAVVAAMRASGGSGGGSQDINVYLDGRQIARSVEKNQRERGATIVNNPNFAY